MRRRFGRATGSLLCVWLAALALANDARAAFELGDLAGNWQIFRRWDTRGGHAPGWDALDATVNASGAPTSGSYVNSDADGSSITGGSLSLDASGRMDGSITLSLYGPITFERWQMDLGETAIAGTGTTTGNRAMLGLALRRGASYANADLIGNWTLLGFADEEVANAPNWFRAELAISNAANPVASGTVFSSEDPSQVVSDVPISIGATGVAVVPDFGLNFQLDAGKTLMGYAQNDAMALPDVEPQLQLMLKHGSGFTNASLAGVWYAYSLFDDRGIPDPVWKRDTIQFAASGAVRAGARIDSDGNRSRISGGSVSVASDGGVNGVLNRVGGDTSVIQDFRLDAHGHVLAGATSDGTGRSLVIAVPEPALGLPIGFALLLGLARLERARSN